MDSRIALLHSSRIMVLSRLVLTLAVSFPLHAVAFCPQLPISPSLNCARETILTRLFDKDPKIEVHIKDRDDDDDDEDVEPGKMRVSEIKAELDLREVSYEDCFDKESLVQRLREVRATGQASPKIIDQFNRQKLESDFSPDKKVEIQDQDIDQAVANDGTLPGGLTPEQFKKLAGNPEIMTLLQNSKMQEAMTLMMTGGRDELEKKLRDDPELRETVEKLDGIMKSLM